MPRLIAATPFQIEAIYRESHGLWGAGLTRADYLGLWHDISRTDWARCHAHFQVWLDEASGVLSSLKVYFPLARIGERVDRLVVLGAIFTPSGMRRRGFATEMIRHVLKQAHDQGRPLALLFSDIGTAFYEQMGFRTLNAQEQWSPLWRARRSAPRGWKLQPMEPSDVGEIRQAHQASLARRSLAVVRDDAHWEFLRVRSESFFARLADSRVVQRCRVVRYEGKFIGYVLSVEGHGEWNVREAGAAGGDPQRIADVLRLDAQRARRAGMVRFYGWLPPEVVEELPEWRIETRRRQRAVPMILPLDGTDEAVPFDDPAACYIPYQDQF